MQIKNPERPSSPISKKLEKKYALFEKLTAALNQHEIPSELAESLNAEVDKLNAISDTAKEKPGKMTKAHSRIIRKVQKELGLVPKNYHRNLWMGIGMAAFGVPMGVSLGMSLDNMAFMAIGLPIGLAIGLAVGSGMDNKAQKDGKQLDIDYEL
jgi:hypothetical protein